MFDALPSSLENIRAGRLRALAVTTKARSEALPEVPSLSDFVPEYEVDALMGVGTPQKTPAEIIDRLNREINAVLAEPKIKARLAELGTRVVIGSPTSYRDYLTEEIDKWGKVVKFAGIKLD